MIHWRLESPSVSHSNASIDEAFGLDPTGKFFAPIPVDVSVQFGAASHSGKMRVTNEDQYLVVCRRRWRDVLLTSLPPSLLPSIEQSAYTLGVADGIGGAAFGQVASSLALRIG